MLFFRCGRAKKSFSRSPIVAIIWLMDENCKMIMLQRYERLIIETMRNSCSNEDIIVFVMATERFPTKDSEDNGDMMANREKMKENRKLSINWGVQQLSVISYPLFHISM